MKTGAAFSDYITSGKPRGMLKRFEKDHRGFRDLFLPVSLILILFIVLFRVFTLQILQGEYYRNLSDSNRIKTITVHAPRGVVLDRNGTPLVLNTPGFRENVNGKTKIIDSNEALALIASGKKDLEIDTLRSYPYKDVLSHVLGYISQISKEELDRLEFSDYKGGDLIGKMGIEQEYEHILKGADGKELIETDSLGRETRKLGKQDPIPGTDITLTIDLKLQKVAYEAIQGVKKGALLVSTPNGGILSLVSKPSFDPNLFTLGEHYKVSSTSSYENLGQVLTDSANQPLLDRVISGLYPPGSTFKIVVAASGLANNVIDQNYEVDDTGIINVGAFSFSNWYFSQYGRTDGMVNVVKGLKRSNDIFFYKLAEKVGVDTISKTANELGLGEKLGIDLQGELTGVVPTSSWKEKNMKEPWFLGDTYHYGIGQGFLLTTPLQVNAWTQIIANGGALYRPHLLKNQKLLSGSQGKEKREKLLSGQTTTLIRQGMIESCSPGGVAWPLFQFTVRNPQLKINGSDILESPQSTNSANLADYRQIVVACKTGTAEHGGEKTLPHAWITLFAPAYNPQIVVTVLAEESGEGSNVAAPIAKKVLEAYFGK